MFALSLYGRTVGLVGVVIVLACVVLATATAAIDTLADRHTALRLQSAVLRADAAATSFVGTADPAYAVETEEALAESAHLLALLDPAAAALLSPPIAAYRQTFDTLRQVFETRGLNESSGAEGRFRQSVQALERSVIDLDRDRLLVHLLNARRFEKDFVLHRSPASVMRVHASSDSMRAVLGRLPLGADRRARLVEQVRSYRRDFDALAALTFELDALRSRLPADQQTASRLTGAVVEQVERRARRFQRIALAVFVFAAVLGLTLAYLVARGIVRPLARLKHAALRIVDGDTDVEVRVEGADEIVALTRAVNEVSRHVHERRQAEDALRTSQQFVETVLGSVQDGVIVLDRALRCLVVNPHVETLTGRTVEDLRGRPAAALLPHFDRDDAHALFRRALAGEVVQSRDLRIMAHGTAAELWYVGTFGPLYDGTGGVIGIVGTLHDVTTRKASERELVLAKEAAEEVARMKSTFLNNMSHEIRTPLTAIIGFAQLMRMELDGEPEELAGIIQESGQRLLTTLNDVLDLARLEADRLPSRVQPVEAAPSACAVADLFRPLAWEKKIEMTVHVAPSEQPHLVYADPGTLDRILTNLLSNAVKFTESGAIHVSVHDAGPHATAIEVGDTGCGIDPTFMPHLFEEFRQGSSGLTRTHEGSGLGLALTKRLVERLGGRIEVETAPGEGSLFRVVLPSSPPDVNRDPKRRDTSAVTAP